MLRGQLLTPVVAAAFDAMPVLRLGQGVIRMQTISSETGAYLAPALSKMGVRKFIMRNSPDVRVDSPMSTHRSISFRMTQSNATGM